MIVTRSKVSPKYATTAHPTRKAHNNIRHMISVQLLKVQNTIATRKFISEGNCPYRLRTGPWKSGSYSFGWPETQETVYGRSLQHFGKNSFVPSDYWYLPYFPLSSTGPLAIASLQQQIKSVIKYLHSGRPGSNRIQVSCSTAWSKISDKTTGKTRRRIRSYWCSCYQTSLVNLGDSGQQWCSEARCHLIIVHMIANKEEEKWGTQVEYCAGSLTQYIT